MAKVPASQLSLKQAAFVSHYIADPQANGKAAALAAGYSQKHAADAACRLLKNSLVKAAIDATRAEIVERGAFDADAAMRQFRADRDFARKVGNANAAVKASELMAKLCGHLVERAEIKVETVDIGGVIFEARKRVALPTVEYTEVLPINPFD